MPLLLPSLLPEHENDDKIQERRSQFSCPLALSPLSTIPNMQNLKIVGSSCWGGKEGGVANNGWRESPRITSYFMHTHSNSTVGARSTAASFENTSRQGKKKRAISIRGQNFSRFCAQI